MDFIKLFFISFFIVSCGPSVATFPRVEIEQSLLPYTRDFEAEWQKRIPDKKITNLIVQFSDIEQDPNTNTFVLGNCVRKEGSVPTINVDRYFWSTLSDTSKRTLMFHELGHCVLFREHFNQGQSIMSSYLISDKKFLNDQENIIDELFNPSTFYSWNLVEHNHDKCNHGDLL